MTRRALVLPLLAAVAAGLHGGVAAADQTPGEALVAYRYAVTVEGTADYARHDQDGAGASDDANVQLGWTAQIPMFQFLGSLPSGGAGDLVGTPTIAVSYRSAVQEADGVDTGACTGGTLDAGASSLDLAPEQPVGGHRLIDAHVFGGEKLRLDGCTGGLAHFRGSLPLGQNVAEGGGDPWLQRFDMPAEAIGQGKIIQLLDRTVTGVDCPGHRPDTTTCTLRWHAKLTFVKTDEEVIFSPADGSDLIVPIPPPAGAGATPPPAAVPATPVTPAPAPQDLGAVLAGAARQAVLSASAAAATIPLSCPAGCSGTATASAAGGARTAATARSLARASFTLSPGATRRVTLRFNTTARRAIRRAGAVRIALRLTAPGAHAPQQRTLTLKLRKR